MNVFQLVEPYIKRFTKDTIVVILFALFATKMVVDKAIVGYYRSRQQVLAHERQRLEFAEQVLKVQAKIPAIKKMLYKKDDISEFISQINTLLKKNDMEVSDLTPGDVLRKGEVKATHLDLEAHGSYAAAVQFVQDIESFKQLVHIAHVSLEREKQTIKSQQQVDNPLIKVSMSLIFFSQRD